MKSIAVVATRIEYARHLRDNLLPFFREYAEIGCYSIDELRNVDSIQEDLVVVSAFTIFQAVKHKIRDTSEMIVASIVVNMDNLAPLAEFPEGTRALLCNIDYRTCMQVISELYMAGYRNLELTPWFGNGVHDPSIELAITPDEPDTVPPGIKTVVDIGQRIIDLNCMYNIAVRLGVGEEFAANETVRRQARSRNARSSIEIQRGMLPKLSQAEHSTRFRFEDIKGRSAAILDTIATAKRLSQSDASILISGESGTGKELFSQSIHHHSARRDYNFVAVNCAAIPETLLESEMFGYEEGSFTGAKKGGRAGYFELSHRGTIFLDEIAELPLPLQSKLLRVIEERKIIKIGSNKIVDVDVRIIAATNKNLFDMMENGLFREDLYYRLNVLPLRLPPLRERPEDIPILIDHFRAMHGFSFTLTPESMLEIATYNWRGNIRELRNMVEYLGSLQKPLIAPADLPLSTERRLCSAPSPTPTSGSWPLIAGDSSRFRSFILREGRQLDLHIFILRELLSADARRERLGRKRLLESAERLEQSHTESEIRNALKRLDEYGLIQIGKGRGGSRITQQGRSLLQWHKQEFLDNK